MVLWGLVLLSLVLPENLPALAVWGRHTLFVPLAVIALALGLLRMEGCSLHVWSSRLGGVYLVAGLAFVWIVVAAWMHRGAVPPVAWGLVAADAVRVAFVGAGLESLRRLEDPVPRIMALFVPLVVLFVAIPALLQLAAFGATARRVVSLHVAFTRVFTGIGDPNFTSIVLVAALGGALGLGLTLRHPGLRWLASLGAAVLVAALARTVSLGGLAGFLALLLILVVGIRGLGFEPRVRRHILTVLVLLVVLAGVLSGGFFWTRIRSEWARMVTTPMDFGDYRGALLVGGVRMLLAHPWAGVGPGRVAAEMHRFIPRDVRLVHTRLTCHDFLVGLGDESGFGPMLAVAGLLAMLGVGYLRRILPLLRRSGERHDPWGMVMAAILGATVLQALALPAQRDPFLWFVVILAAADLVTPTSGSRSPVR
jgi:hypothetical protein